MSDSTSPTMLRQVSMIQKPLPYDKRHCTDCCCVVIGILFTAILLGSSFFLYNSELLARSSNPSDNQGKVCGHDLPQYNILYFTNLNDISKRVCVSKCPKSGDTSLDCAIAGDIGCTFNKVQGFSVAYYDNELVADSNGNICMPTNAAAREALQSKTKLDDRNLFFKSYSVMLLCLAISIGLALLYFILVQCFPKCTLKVAIYLSLLVTLGLAVILFLYKTENSVAKIILAVILGLVFISTLLTICLYRQNINISAIFLEHATKFCSENCTTILFIPLFLLMTAAFIFMMIIEYRAFWTVGSGSFDASKSLYWKVQSTGSYILMGVFIVQLIWGLSFLKEAFNFCIGSAAVRWYLGEQTGCCGCCEILKLLFFKHLGSVIVSAFINSFFLIPDILMDYLRGCLSCSTCCNDSNYCCKGILELVRQDTLSYVSLTGNPFCNSAKYCEYLSNESMLTDHSQSTLRTYRICAHLLISGAVGLLSLFLKGEINPIIMVVVMVIGMFCSTYFISYHADAAEAIQMMYLLEEEFTKRGSKTKMSTDPFNESDQQRYIRDAQTIHPKFPQLGKSVAQVKQEYWSYKKEKQSER